MANEDEGREVTAEMKEALQQGMRSILSENDKMDKIKEEIKAIYEQLKEWGWDVAEIKGAIRKELIERKNPNKVEHDREGIDYCHNIYKGLE